MIKHYYIWPPKTDMQNDPEMDRDMELAVHRASLNLEIRHQIILSLIKSEGPQYMVKIDGDDLTSFSGRRLRGIAKNLLKINREKYESMKLGDRVLFYMEVKT